MAKKRNKKNIPFEISPYVWGYLSSLEIQGVHVEQAYLFGSWAKGTEHKDSDIDLAIISKNFKTWDKKNRLLAKAKRFDFCNIESHGFHPDSFKVDENPVVSEVKQTGIKLIS
jgi:uncharacterized protein